MTAKTDGFVKDTLTISGNEIAVHVGEVPHADLKFFTENPRVYTILNAEEDEPTQGVIQSRLEKMEHVKTLINSIKSNGGLTDPVIVRKRVVLEGNSRLAAYRVLARHNEAKWARIRCKILPDDTDDALVFSLLGQYHIIGRKDWAPYEQAGYLFRRVKNHHVNAEQIARELGISVKGVNQLIEVYEFMRKHGEDRVDRWSYYDDYLSKHATKRARAEHPELDKVIVAKIRAGEIEKATDIRDKVAKICVAGGKVLSSFVQGKKSLDEALHGAVTRGADDVHYKRLKKFREQVQEPDLKGELLEMSSELRKKCIYELDKIASETAKLKRALE